MSLKNQISLVRRIIARQLLLCGLVLATGQSLAAQTPPASPAPTTVTAPAPSLEKRIFQNFLVDQKLIWTSPFRLRWQELKWVTPLLATTSILLATDQQTTTTIRAQVARQPAQLAASRRVSLLGAPITTYGLAGGLYALGHATHNLRLRETGVLGVAALLHSSIVVNALKVATNRQRPAQGTGRGRFWSGGKSFPSGHAGTSFALATVIAHEYRDQPLIRWGAYGVAAAISAARVTGLKHHPSDVVAGGALGYLIGRYVVRHYASDTSRQGPQTTLHPHWQPSTHAIGLGIQWSF